jgi:RNA polymerase sigma-70 factor (ECF subfamily)
MPASGTDGAPPVDAALTVEALAVAGAPREAALFRLRAFLVAVGWFELERRRWQLTLTPAEAARLVHDAAEAAREALLSRLGEYRGQSRFAVWAAKFAIHETAAAARATATARGKTGAGGVAGDRDRPR